MAYKGGVRDSNTIRDGRIPLWPAVHEAGHLMARIQLVAAWNLDGLDNPSSFDSIRVWINERGKPRGLCQWGYREPLSFRYQAIISAAGPVAEARIRHAKRYNCLTAGEDDDIIMRSQRRGLADIDEALKEAAFIVRACWPEIIKLGMYLQTHHELSFPQVSALLDLKAGRCIYDENTRPDTRYGAQSVCNDFGNNIPYSDYLAAFSETRIPVKWPNAAPNLEPREDIWPTDRAPVIRRLEDGTNEFSELRWGFPPARPKGPPVINFRSEGRRFPVGRCLVPASHFFEFTGTTSPKTKWKFTKAGEDWFCFAGLWRPMSTGGEAFTLLTTDPSPDVAPIHDRQMVLLERSDWSAWLEQTGNEADLLKALPAGSLRVEQVR